MELEIKQFDNRPGEFFIYLNGHKIIEGEIRDCPMGEKKGATIYVTTTIEEGEDQCIDGWYGYGDIIKAER
jgi:hypothetical protein